MKIRCELRWESFRTFHKRSERERERGWNDLWLPIINREARDSHATTTAPINNVSRSVEPRDWSCLWAILSDTMNSNRADELLLLLIRRFPLLLLLLSIRRDRLKRWHKKSSIFRLWTSPKGNRLHWCHLCGRLSKLFKRIKICPHVNFVFTIVVVVYFSEAVTNNRLY